MPVGLTNMSDHFTACVKGLNNHLVSEILLKVSDRINLGKK